MHGLAVALSWAEALAQRERNPAKVERFALELIVLSTRHNFPYWMAIAAIFRGWARSALGETTEGLSWIEDGIRDYRSSGSTIALTLLPVVRCAFA